MGVKKSWDCKRDVSRKVRFRSKRHCEKLDSILEGPMRSTSFLGALSGTSCPVFQPWVFSAEVIKRGLRGRAWGKKTNVRIRSEMCQNK